MINKNKQITTFEREMQDAKFKKAFDKEYQEFAVKELLTAMAEGCKICPCPGQSSWLTS